MADDPRSDEQPPIRVLVVDDHDLVAEALVAALAREPDLFVVGRAGSVDAAVRAARQFHPDVVLMDFQLPDGDGTDATAVIKQELPETEVAMSPGSRKDPCWQARWSRDARVSSRRVAISGNCRRRYEGFLPARSAYLQG